MVDVGAFLYMYITAPTCHHSPTTDLYKVYAFSWQPEGLQTFSATSVVISAFWVNKGEETKEIRLYKHICRATLNH